MKFIKMLPILLIVILILMFFKKNKELFDDNLGWWKMDKYWPD